MQPERAGKWEEVSVWGGGTGRREREGDREEKRGAERSAGLKLTFDTQEVQESAWISFVSL